MGLKTASVGLLALIAGCATTPRITEQHLSPLTELRTFCLSTISEYTCLAIVTYNERETAFDEALTASRDLFQQRCSPTADSQKIKTRFCQHKDYGIFISYGVKE